MEHHRALSCTTDPICSPLTGGNFYNLTIRFTEDTT